jgi:BirA family biotin operon repressor/biotin-[acetyl-CoA-carboxylase] ligase
LLASRKGIGGTVVVADEQLRGEGRHGSYWHSPLGGLWFSLILDCPAGRRSTFIYPLVAATAVTEVLVRDYDCIAELSWPNDVVVEGRKICGVMCRTKAGVKSPPYAILGVGVNLNNREFPLQLRENATSLSLATGLEEAPLDFLRKLLPLLDCLFNLARSDQSLLVARLQESLPYLGSLVRLRGLQGERVVRLEGIDELGRLLVRADGGQEERIESRELVSIMPAE